MVGYRGMHHRLTRHRGPAASQPCSAPGCERPAKDWAWNREGDPADEANYRPLCRTHHTMLDGGGSLTHCPQGHDRAEWGTKANGQCRGCAARYNSQRDRRNR